MALTSEFLASGRQIWSPWPQTGFLPPFICLVVPGLREGSESELYQLTHPEGRVRMHDLGPPLPGGSVPGATGRAGSLRDPDEWLGISPPHLELFPVLGEGPNPWIGFLLLTGYSGF